MAIPPFPSQDLAKLVLGYLAEEQLMTVYDEFLQGSPYLDAFKNEYDRIFMTSLRNILAEYRAVKIYVETCKPYLLRRRLFGCTNLLEIVKFLVQNVDINKIQGQDKNQSSMERTSFEKSFCAVCKSLKLASCVCNNRNSFPSHAISENTNQTDDLVTEQSVETTSLEDLPGNHVTTRRKVRTLPKDQSLLFDIDAGTNTNSVERQIGNVDSCGVIQNTQIIYNNNLLSSDNLSVGTHPSTTQLDMIDISKPLPFGKRINNSNSESIAGTFQDFSKGVEGGIVNVPDSSTSECMNTQSVLAKDISLTRSKKNGNTQQMTKAHILLSVGSVKRDSASQGSDNGNVQNQAGLDHLGNYRTKHSEQKVTILSDIKVDKGVTKENPKMPTILKNATSTPLMQMQTILINGTPVYKQPTPQVRARNFTKDEIMAMPTIIVVPTSGPPTLAHPTVKTLVSKPTCQDNNRALGPLVIDVTSDSNDGINTATGDMPTLNQSIEHEKETLVKALEVKHVSLPKTSNDVDKCTPSVNPPLRKSSSTPRRTSHVRVLDFTTPRRILGGPFEEQGENSKNDQVEAIVSRSPNLHNFVESTSCDAVSTEINDAKKDSKSSESCKEKQSSIKKLLPVKKCNWDADLRAAARVNRKEDIPESRIQPRCRPRPTPNQKPKANRKNKLSMSKKENGMKHDFKISKTPQKKKKILEEIVATEDTVSVQVKPSVTAESYGDAHPEGEKTDNHLNKLPNEELEDTPEAERLSLQNAIGVKLNISDLLETPYKQALYDIQMETPRCLGPDLPGEPLSDIKITSIPTPRFLNNTPKPTPSSYSSRPTDYSSGGSYYKPDDQDYLYIEDLAYPSSSKDIVTNTNFEEKNDSSEKKPMKSSRPVRKCAKNVSYYNNTLTNKTKDGDKVEDTSSCSESVDVPETPKKLGERALGPKRNKSKTKMEVKKTKTLKTPQSKDSHKKFIKIKARRVTPTKENLNGKSRRKTTEGQGRKRTSSKDNTKPILVSAPTKSRRKSSTPRKLHAINKSFNSESSGHDSPELIQKAKQKTAEDSTAPYVQDSDTEHAQLRWSDDGSQDAKPQEVESTSPVLNDSEDISKIKDFIASELKTAKANEFESNLHVDLVKRGFDIETAKIIERDLLDGPPIVREHSVTGAVVPRNNEVVLDKTNESEISLKIDVQEEDAECDEFELSEYDCDETSANYFTYQHDETNNPPLIDLPKLKDKFSMEVCIEDGVTVRLRATPFSILLDQDPKDMENDHSSKEIEMAVSSISNMDKLYTPMKDSIRAQVYDIFDSTLTSLDTPLKATSPKKNDCDATITEIVLEVEKVEDKDKTEGNKRKRLSSTESDESTTKTKKPKPETQYLLTSANIQNIDIETVLSKLHGP